MRLSIILPTYLLKKLKNVGEAIDGVEDALRSHDFEVMGVNDNSPNGTADIAESLDRTMWEHKGLGET